MGLYLCDKYWLWLRLLDRILIGDRAETVILNGVNIDTSSDPGIRTDCTGDITIAGGIIEASGGGAGIGSGTGSGQGSVSARNITK